MWFALACTSSPPLAEQYASDPGAARERIAAMSAGERTVAIDVVTRELPGKTADLCEMLDVERDRAWCHARNRRPHLWTEPGLRADAIARPGGGPESVTIPEFPELSLPPEGPAGALPECRDTLCREASALALVRSGAWQAAADACGAIDAPKWRDECIFSAAEAALGVSTPAGYPAAAALCGRAGQFEVDCQRHLLEALARQGADAAVVAATWSASPGVSAWAVDHVRSLAAPRLAELGGDIDEELKPYVRMERALAVVEAGTSSLASALSALGAIRASGVGVTPVEGGGIVPLWPADAPGEESLPAISVRGRTRRVVEVSPDVDRRICVLEAAAAARNTALVEEGVHDPDPQVRWTAARLLTGLGVDDAAVVALAADSDPLVRARAARTVPASSIAPGGARHGGGPVHPGAGRLRRGERVDVPESRPL